MLSGHSRGFLFLLVGVVLNLPPHLSLGLIDDFSLSLFVRKTGSEASPRADAPKRGSFDRTPFP